MPGVSWIRERVRCTGLFAEPRWPPSLVVLDLHIARKGIDGWPGLLRLYRFAGQLQEVLQSPPAILIVSHTFAGFRRGGGLLAGRSWWCPENAFLPVSRFFAGDLPDPTSTILLAGRRPHATLSVLVVDDSPGGIREGFLNKRAGTFVRPWLPGGRCEEASGGWMGRSMCLPAHCPPPDSPQSWTTDLSGMSLEIPLLASLKRPGTPMVGDPS